MGFERGEILVFFLPVSFGKGGFFEGILLVFLWGAGGLWIF